MCNPEYLMPNEKETTLLLDEEGNLAIVNRGYFFCTAYMAMKKHGWEERDFGHICETCVKEEAYQAEMDQESGAQTFVGLDNPSGDAIVGDNKE
jgi:hypothetical protein